MLPFIIEDQAACAKQLADSLAGVQMQFKLQVCKHQIKDDGARQCPGTDRCNAIHFPLKYPLNEEVRMSGAFGSHLSVTIDSDSDKPGPPSPFQLRLSPVRLKDKLHDGSMIGGTHASLPTTVSQAHSLSNELRSPPLAQVYRTISPLSCGLEGFVDLQLKGKADYGALDTTKYSTKMQEKRDLAGYAIKNLNEFIENGF